MWAKYWGIRYSTGLLAFAWQGKKSIGVGILDSNEYKVNNILFVDDDIPTETQMRYYTALDNFWKYV